jgi:hypothetical protein
METGASGKHPHCKTKPACLVPLRVSARSGFRSGCLETVFVPDVREHIDGVSILKPFNLRDF